MQKLNDYQKANSASAIANGLRNYLKGLSRDQAVRNGESLLWLLNLADNLHADLQELSDTTAERLGITKGTDYKEADNIRNKDHVARGGKSQKLPWIKA